MNTILVVGAIGGAVLLDVFAVAIGVVHCANKKPWPEDIERFRK